MRVLPHTDHEAAVEAWNALFDEKESPGHNRHGMKYIVVRGISEQGGGVVQNWFEYDDEGFVYRNFQVGICGQVDISPRFAPEHFIHNSTVSFDHMRNHPDARFIDAPRFESDWNDFRDTRPFIRLIPTPHLVTLGQIRDNIICWVPEGRDVPPCLTGSQWAVVPGFERLLVELKDEEDDSPDRVHRSIFLELDIDWWNEDGEPIEEQ